MYPLYLALSLLLSTSLCPCLPPLPPLPPSTSLYLYIPLSTSRISIPLSLHLSVDTVRTYRALSIHLSRSTCTLRMHYGPPAHHHLMQHAIVVVLDVYNYCIITSVNVYPVVLRVMHNHRYLGWLLIPAPLMSNEVFIRASSRKARRPYTKSPGCRFSAPIALSRSYLLSAWATSRRKQQSHG